MVALNIGEAGICRLSAVLRMSRNNVPLLVEHRNRHFVVNTAVFGLRAFVKENTHPQLFELSS